MHVVLSGLFGAYVFVVVCFLLVSFSDFLGTCCFLFCVSCFFERERERGRWIFVLSNMM